QPLGRPLTEQAHRARARAAKARDSTGPNWAHVVSRPAEVEVALCTAGSDAACAPAPTSKGARAVPTGSPSPRRTMTRLAVASALGITSVGAAIALAAPAGAVTSDGSAYLA